MNEYQTKALYRKYDIESPLTELIGGQQSVQIMKYIFFFRIILYFDNKNNIFHKIRDLMFFLKLINFFINFLTIYKETYK